MSFADYLDYWMEHYCRVNLKRTTCEGYERHIRNHLQPALGHYQIQSFSPLALQNYINSFFQAGYSRNSVSVVKGILSGAFRYAVSYAGFLTVNPMTAVKMPHRRAQARVPTRKKKREALTIDQWQAIINRFPEGHSCHLPLMLAYHLGLRLGETFGLCWEDVDFANGTISINRQVQWNRDEKCWEFTDPKYDSFRTVSADPTLMALLEKEKKKQERAKAYFEERYQQVCVNERQQIGREGTPVQLINVRENGSYIQPRVTQNMNHIVHTQLGLPLFDFHTLRHTHATALMEAGANMVDIQERLGHAKLEMTWRYAHDTDVIRRRTAALLAELYC